MRENSDKRIDELLNSFIDGELTIERQNEVEKLIDRDEKIARRLTQLRTCKVLLNSLPRSEAPPKILAGVKASLAGTTIRAEVPLSYEKTHKKYPRIRRVLAAAAMIGVAAVLVTVMRTMITPQVQPEQSIISNAIEGTASGLNVADSRVFSGTLELKTNDLVAVSASINKAIENINHSEAIHPARRQDRRIYNLSCTEDDLKSLLADLKPLWPKLDSAALSVNTNVFGDQIVVDAVTTEQIAQIADESRQGRRVEMARDFAALNNMASLLPGRAVASAIKGENEHLIHDWLAPKPALAQRETPAKRTPSQSQDKETVRLTIIVSW